MTALPPMRALVVDDEDLGRQKLINLLQAREDVRVVGEADNVDAALALIEEARPDVLFLDVRMPGRGGFDLLGALEGDRRPHVILVTAHEEHALRGFQEDAVDFLLKPFDRRRLNQAVERALERVRGRHRDELLARLAEALGSGLAGSKPTGWTESAEGEASARPLRKLVVKSRDRKVLVDVADIRWIEAADYYARLHTGSSAHLIRRSLTWLEDHLDPGRFVRIHRSSIVNVDYVSEIVPWSGGSYDVTLDDGTELRLSGGRKAELERLLGQSL